MLEIYFDANFSCTSPSHAKPVDALACALHWKSNTEAVGMFQGFSAPQLLVKSESFSYDLEDFSKEVACEFLF